MARNNFKQNQNKMVSYFKRNWIPILVTILIVVLVVPLIVYKIQDFIRGLKENQLENAATLEDTKVKTEQAVNSTENTHKSEEQLTDKFKIIQKKFSNRNISPALWKEIKADAFNLANSLGTDAKSNSSWFGMSWLEDRPDPSAFFENEKEAKRILKKYPRTFDVLAELYYRLATRSKDLRTDLKKYLSESDLKEMRIYYKKYNKTWL